MPPRKAGRARGVPVQIYFSELEHAGLLELAAKQGDTVAGVVRRLLACAINAEGISVSRVDPRQVDMF
jgi:hypothetical protein